MCNERRSASARPCILDSAPLHFGLEQPREFGTFFRRQLHAPRPPAAPGRAAIPAACDVLQSAVHRPPHARPSTPRRHPDRRPARRRARCRSAHAGAAGAWSAGARASPSSSARGESVAATAVHAAVRAPNLHVRDRRSGLGHLIANRVGDARGEDGPRTGGTARPPVRSAPHRCMLRRSAAAAWHAPHAVDVALPLGRQTDVCGSSMNSSRCLRERWLMTQARSSFFKFASA